MEKENDMVSMPTETITPTETTPKKKLSRKKLAAIICAVVVVLAGAITATCIAVLNNSPEQIADPTEPTEITPDADFDFTFLRLENEEGKNIIYSPLSIKYALAMLQEATDGDSKTQIDKLIGQNVEFKTYTNSDKQSLANAIFIKEDKKDSIYNTYTDTLKQKFGASVIYDPFTSAAPMNKWISDNTLGLINNLLTDRDLENDGEADFILVNALGINMYWNNKIQCSNTTDKDGPGCKNKIYSVRYAHEDYGQYVQTIGTGYNFKEIAFNGGKKVQAAEIGASINNYDIIAELGEDYIRKTVLDAYDEYVKAGKKQKDEPDVYDIDKYIEELKENYGRVDSSTDFSFLETETEKVFAKDLQGTDTSSLRYVGIMPKTGTLSEYVESLTTEKARDIIKNIKDTTIADNFKPGVVTKITGYIPFFDFEYDLKLVEDLETLGVTNIFMDGEANLIKMTGVTSAHISDAKHRANIEFSNDGIKAAAVTAFVGGLGSGGAFDYLWDVPVEEIDLTFDSPFMFLIYDKDSGEIWFTGAVYNI